MTRHCLLKTAHPGEHQYGEGEIPSWYCNHEEPKPHSRVSILVLLDAETVAKAETLANEQAEGNRSRLIRALIRSEWLRTHEKNLYTEVLPPG